MVALMKRAAGKGKTGATKQRKVPIAGGRDTGIPLTFEFDSQSLDILQEIAAVGGYGSLAATVTEALRIVRALQEHAAAGFTEIIVQHPKTGEQRILPIKVS